MSEMRTGGIKADRLHSSGGDKRHSHTYFLKQGAALKCRRTGNLDWYPGKVFREKLN